MSDPRTRFEKEEDRIDAMLDRGEISKEEYREEMRLLRQEYRESMEQAGEEARQRELENW